MSFDVGPQIKITDQAMMKVPGELREITLFAAMLGAKVVDRMRRRISREQKGPDGKQMGPYLVTGGMWKSLEVKKGRHAFSTSGFFRSSYSKKFFEQNKGRIEAEEKKKADRSRRRPAGSTSAKKATGATKAAAATNAKKARTPRGKSTANPRAKSKSWAQEKKAARVRNRVKGEACQKSKNAAGRNILDLSPAEHRAVLWYIARICERKIFTHPNAKPGDAGPSGDAQLATALKRIGRWRGP